ncbi:MAG TPA: UDP-N-acetylglucosamine diphosphorylase [Rhabdochlamydiaceae bacterium]
MHTKNYFSSSLEGHESLFDERAYPWEALKRLQAYLESLELGKIEIELPDSVHLVHPSLISIAKGVVIEPNVFIQGPCIIGPKCVIRFGAYIRGNVILGKSCVVGHSTEVKHAIFFDSAKAAHFNYVGDSILGADVNLGAGVKCANYRLDGETISVSWDGKKINTGLKKFGAIVGDGAQIGCNSVTNPGTLVGKNAVILPCLNVGGTIAEGGMIKSTKETKCLL